MDRGAQTPTTRRNHGPNTAEEEQDLGFPGRKAGSHHPARSAEGVAGPQATDREARGRARCPQSGIQQGPGAPPRAAKSRSCPTPPRPARATDQLEEGLQLPPGPFHAGAPAASSGGRQTTHAPPVRHRLPVEEGEAADSGPCRRLQETRGPTDEGARASGEARAIAAGEAGAGVETGPPTRG